MSDSDTLIEKPEGANATDSVEQEDEKTEEKVLDAFAVLGITKEDVDQLLQRKLGDLLDVDVSGVTDGQKISYDADNKKWTVETVNTTDAIQASTVSLDSDTNSDGTYNEAGVSDTISLTTTTECKFYVIARELMEGNSDTGREFGLKIQIDSVDISGTEVTETWINTSTDGPRLLVSTGLTSAKAAGTYLFRAMHKTTGGATATFSEGELTVMALPTGN